METSMTLTDLQNRAWQTAKDKGFIDIKPERTIGDQLMLAVGELSEALEEIRAGHPPSLIYYKGVCKCGYAMTEKCETCGTFSKPEGFPIEIADCIIRLGQLAETCQFDLNNATKLKMDYNDTRPALHGGKKL